MVEIAEWKPSYCPPQTSEIQEIQTCSSSTQAQICAESAESAERETEENEIEKHSSQEHNNTLVSSSYVPSSQKRHVVLVDQPLKGLVPEELCSSSSETSQIRGSSKESYSILQERSSPGGNAPDVSIVASSQNSHEFEIEQPLSHVTSERTQFHCSLSESQLGKLFVSSVSFDEVTSPPCISDGLLPMQEGFTQIKPRRLSTKRKRSQTDDSVQKTHSSVGVRQGNKLLLTDSPVSPDSSPAVNLDLLKVSVVTTRCPHKSYAT
ncbi:hypothetical protein ACROYT_G014412 [Oculina patagonica]